MDCLGTTVWTLGRSGALSMLTTLIHLTLHRTARFELDPCLKFDVFLHPYTGLDLILDMTFVYPEIFAKHWNKTLQISIL